MKSHTEKNRSRGRKRILGWFRCREGFRPRNDVDAVDIYRILLDNAVAQIDTNVEMYPLIIRQRQIPLRDFPLIYHGNGAEFTTLTPILFTL